MNFGSFFLRFSFLNRGSLLVFSESVFARVFSEYNVSESSESSSSDEEEDDFSVGVKTFLAKHDAAKKCSFLERLLGCATVERVSTYQLPGQEEQVVDLDLLCVRKKYRGFNVGKYLLQLVQSRKHM